MFRWLLPAIVLTLASLPVQAQTFTDLPMSAPAGYSAPRSHDSGWFEFTDQPGCWGWYQRNRLAGRYWKDIDIWQAWDGRRWSPETQPPWQRPDQLSGARRQADGTINLGLETSKLNKHGERFMVNDAEVSRAEIPVIYGNGSFKDDSLTKHVTVFDANPQRRAQTVQVLKQQLGNVRLNDYNPTDPNQQTIALAGWKLPQDQRFMQTGQMVAVQAPADKDEKGNATGYGKVLDAYHGPVTAEVGAAIARAADPNYDPNKAGAGITFSWAGLWKILYPLLLILLGIGGGATGAVAVLRGKTVVAKPAAKTFGDSIVAALQQWKADQDARAEAVKHADEEDARVRAALLALAGGK